MKTMKVFTGSFEDDGSCNRLLGTADDEGGARALALRCGIADEDISEVTDVCDARGSVTDDEAERVWLVLTAS